MRRLARTDAAVAGISGTPPQNSRVGKFRRIGLAFGAKTARARAVESGNAFERAQYFYFRPFDQLAYSSFDAKFAQLNLSDAC